MQQLFITGTAKTEWRDAPELAIEDPRAALVRPLAVSICDADATILRGLFPFPFPYPFGHEAAGEVVAVGDEVRNVRVGDRVVVPFQISCGVCVACSRGHTAACEEVRDDATYGQFMSHAAYGFGDVTRGYGGVLGDQVLVPFADGMLATLPSGLAPAQAASAADNLSDAWRLVGPTLRSEPNADVLVVAGQGGAASIGLYAVALARALGASKVDYVGANGDLLSIAARLGATPIEASEPAGRLGRYRLTVDASAHPKWLATAIRSTDWFGTCATSGIYFADVSLPLGEAYNQGLRLEIGWVNARAVIPEVLGLLERGLDLSPIHTIAPWDSAVDALAGPLPPKLVLER